MIFLFIRKFLYSGWLGILLGNKFYINYAKKSFDTAYSETLAELRALMNASEKKSTISPAKKRIVYFFIFENISIIRLFV